MKNYFKLSNVLPERAEYATCLQIMSNVDDLAPSDSHVNAVISQLADGTYHTIIAIKAACGHFYAEAKTSSLVLSLKHAQKNMLKNLEEWKSLRFKI